MTSGKAVQQVLTDAAALIDKGWVQGRQRATVDGVDCFCATGAITEVVKHEQNGPALWLTATRAVNLRLDSKVYPSMVDYNDTKGRKAHEVSALLRSAALEAGA